LRSERFELVDQEGNVRARLSMVNDVPTLVFYDENGTMRMRLTIPTDTHGGLTFFDKAGNPEKK
jgi:hypothetical protein